MGLRKSKEGSQEENEEEKGSKSESEEEEEGAEGEEDPGDSDAEKDDDKGQDDLDLESLDAKTQKYVKKLRQESARYRTSAKDLKTKFDALTTRMGAFEKGMKEALGIEDKDEVTPEKLQAVQSENMNLGLKAAVLEQAVERGVTKAQLPYFKFLVSEAMDELKEGEELSEEQIEACAQEARSKVGNSKTSVSGNGKDGEGKTPPPKPGELTLDQFIAMSITEKSLLHQKNPEVYKKLLLQAKTAKKLV